MNASVRWVSGRALLLHLSLALTLPLCGIAAWWQVHRALTGNTLSWLYVFEWPAFAGIAVWFWWVLLTLPGRQAAAPAPPARSPRADLLVRRRAPLRWDPARQPESVRSYNAFLADLNAGRPATRPRKPPRRTTGASR